MLGIYTNLSKNVVILNDIEAENSHRTQTRINPSMGLRFAIHGK
ncbi:hypothetical protein [uncultured Vibrio sp.]|nr:hypothetical protein [uncultured Vibrio sp.]